MHTTSISAAVLAFAAAVPFGLHATEPPAELSLVDVAPGVVMFSNDRGSNLTCIALDDGLVFVDTGLSTTRAARFRTLMEARFDRPTTGLVLTHGHLDHMLAMAAFDDVEVIAAAQGRPLIEHQVALEFDERAIAMYSGIFPTFRDDVGEAAPFMPTRWFEDGLTLGRPDSRIVVTNIGGHSVGSSAVWVPHAGVLVAGDLVQVDKFPYFGDPTNDLGAWMEALDTWSAMEIEMVCPGHGRAVSRDYLRPIRTYFADLRATFTRLHNEGVDLEAAVVHSDLPRGYWPEDLAVPRWWLMCLAREYRALESRD